MWHISVWVALLWLPLATPLVAVRAGVVVQGSMRSTPSRPATAACPSAARLRGSDGCRRRSSEVRMFGPGGGGGFLGVGTPEMVVIGAVAWALIGPKELYKLAQQAGQFLGEWQQLGRQAQSTFKDALESELGNDLMDKAKEAGSEATSIAQKMQTELAQTDFRGKVKDLADYAKPVAESAAAAAAAASTAAGSAAAASSADGKSAGPSAPLADDWQAPLMEELKSTLGDPESNRKTFADQISGVTNERVMAAMPEAMVEEEEFLSTEIAEAENQLAMLRTEAKVLALRKKQQETNIARRLEQEDLAAELAASTPVDDVPKEL